MAFDNQGNKWFGTWGYGILKFDGTTWVNYTTSNSGLSHDSIRSIAVDKEGVIWIGAYGGGSSDVLNKFDGVNWTYQPIYRGIFSIAIDRENNKWISNSSGVLKFDGVNWTFYYYLDPWWEGNEFFKRSQGFFNISRGIGWGDIYTAVAFDKNGSNWMGSSGGVSRLSTTNPIIFSISPENYNVGKDAGTVFYQIITNVQCIDSCASSWCAWGKYWYQGGNDRIMVDYQPNFTSSTRISTIYVKVDGLGLQQVTLTQHPTNTATILASVNPTNSGTVNGQGDYSFGGIATLSAFRQKGFAFVNWTENGIEMSKDSIYTFTVSDDRNLVANFQRDIGISEFDKELSIYIYPNPAKEIFTVNIYRLTNFRMEVSLYDLSGSLLQKYNCDTNSSCQFDVSTLPAGCYVVQINTGNELYTRKLMVIR